MSVRGSRLNFRIWVARPALCMLGVALTFGMSPGSRADAQEDDEEAVVEMPQFHITDETFDQWLFSNQGAMDAVLKRLETRLALSIDNVHRSVALSDAQRKKLQLAGRGDIKRYFERVDVVRSKFHRIKNDPNKINEIWTDIQPLQSTLASGLFGEGSIFCKTVRKTLHDSQWSEFNKVEQERRSYRYRVTIELTVSTLESGLPLLDEQRQKFIALLLEETRPPPRAGQYDNYVVMLKTSRIPEEKLKPLFDDVQWKILQNQLQQARGMEQWLKESGYLDADVVGVTEPIPGDKK